MGIQYTLKIDGDILFVTASGSDESPSDVEEYTSALLKICLENGVRRALCDETAVTTSLNTLDTYEIGMFLSKTIPTWLKIAIVFDPDTSFDLRFFESLVVNRGQQIKIFADTGSAMTWLLD